MIRMFGVVIACLAIVGIIPVSAFAAPAQQLSLQDQIGALEAQLAKEPIQIGDYLSQNTASCVIYTPANIRKVEKLLKLHIEAKTKDVLSWREQLGWMYEKCGRGVGDPWLPPNTSVPALTILPQTRGLERAHRLYNEALKSERADGVAIKIAQAYENKYLEIGDDSLLMQARYWRQKGKESIDSIQARHKSIHQDWMRKQPRVIPRPKIGQTGTEDFLRAVFISCVFADFLVLFFMKLSRQGSGISYHYYLIPSLWTCYSFRWWHRWSPWATVSF